jgi:uncharacterized protein YdhG (YjbR/CyaY superfamily)
MSRYSAPIAWNAGFDLVDLAMTKKPETVDAYLAGIISVDARESLTRLREIICEELPDAEEVIKYGIPTYTSHGYVASFAAFKNHCSFFPGHTVNEFADQLKDYKTAKGTIQFPHNQPLPESLVRAMLHSRRAENLAAKSD